MQQDLFNKRFLKQGYPQIIHFNGIFYYKPSIWGYPICGNPHMRPLFRTATCMCSEGQSLHGGPRPFSRPHGLLGHPIAGPQSDSALPQSAKPGVPTRIGKLSHSKYSKLMFNISSKCLRKFLWVMLGIGDVTSFHCPNRRCEIQESSLGS